MRAEPQDGIAGRPGRVDGLVADVDGLLEPPELDQGLELGGQQRGDEVAVAGATVDRDRAAQLAERLVVAADQGQRPAEIPEALGVGLQLVVVDVGEQREGGVEGRARRVGAAGDGVARGEHRVRGVFEPAVTDGARLGQRLGRQVRDGVVPEVGERQARHPHAEREAPE